MDVPAFNCFLYGHILYKLNEKVIIGCSENRCQQ